MNQRKIDYFLKEHGFPTCLVAGVFVKHWDARLEVMDGKAMVVCMSRRIC
jgi:hypothetical protein